MARYRVAEGREVSHSERVEVELPTRPRTYRVGYEGRTYRAGDELELPDKDGARLVESGVVEPVGKRRKSKSK